MTGPTFNNVVNDALRRIVELNKACVEARRLKETEQITAEEYTYAYRSIKAEIDYCITMVKTGFKTLTI